MTDMMKKPGIDQVLSNEHEQPVKHKIDAMFNLLSNLFGSDKLVLKASKLEALQLMRSEDLGERVLALQKLVFEDPTLDTVPQPEEIDEIISQAEEELAGIIARRSLEDSLEKRIAEKLQERHEEYVKEIKMQILNENAGPENAQTLKKLAILEKLEQTKLAKSAMEVLRPQTFEEIVGQERSITALLAKLASPFPQHILLYGPPGVGKTSAARLVLETVKKLEDSPFSKDAPFIEVDGTTLRWDPRDVTNPLLGSVHDPIYQGARKDLAETGIPEPKPGLVTDAHGGVLFVDEIGEMDPVLLNKLLKVLEDKRVTFESSYYDPHDPNIPQYIKKLFEEGAPADFILIGATTRSPAEINPAIRSRCAEVFFEPLTPFDIQEIVRKAAAKLGAVIEPEAVELISEYTIEGRKANNILADAYGMALYKQKTVSGKSDKGELKITKEIVYQVIQSSRLTPYVSTKAINKSEVGKIFGLGVSGFVGSIIEIEAVAFPAREKGKGQIRFNDTAGSMAKDSVFNAVSVIRKLTGEDVSNYDIHVNVVGGGNIDGPSAGIAIMFVILSAILGKPVRQDIAVTGEISVQGKVKPVGGIFEKIFGAKQAGIAKVIIPKDNAHDIPVGLKGIEVVTVEQVEDAIRHIFSEELTQLKVS